MFPHSNGTHRYAVAPDRKTITGNYRDAKDVIAAAWRVLERLANASGEYRMVDKPSFVIINTRGHAENLAYDHNHTWESILERIYLSGMSAGGNDPRPADLYRNGVKVADQLWDKAYKFGTTRAEIYKRASAELSSKFPAPWKEDDNAG
jgi:hypothetical protein